MSVPSFLRKVDVRDYNKFLNYPNAIENEEVLDKFEEIFFLILEQTFGYMSPLTKGFDELFVPENFFPEIYGKSVGEGSWIRINTETGYRVYYAKKSSKRMSPESLSRQLKKANQSLNRLTKENPKVKDLEELDKDLKDFDKIKKITNEYELAQYVEMMPSDLYYVKALRTKSQYMYLLPSEYELINNIQDYVEAVLDKQTKRSIKYRQIFTKQDTDQVFYMQSRGIPKDVAVMMCRLQQCYFEVDVQALFVEYMVPTPETIIKFEKIRELDDATA